MKKEKEAEDRNRKKNFPSCQFQTFFFHPLKRREALIGGEDANKNGPFSLLHNILENLTNWILAKGIFLSFKI